MPRISHTGAAFLFPALLWAASARPSPGTESARSLDLEKQMGSLFVTIEEERAITDPHEMECGNCHSGEDPTAVESLRFGDDTISLCRDCHEDSNLHPVGIDAPGVIDPGEQPLPLGKGVLEGKITCLTCHYLHASNHERHILRSSGSESRMTGLCARCHGNSLREKSPHSPRGECHLCHMNDPREGEALESLDPNLMATCNFCHSALENMHYLDVNPFSDEYILKETFEAKIPLLNGRFTCISCHDPHSAEGKKKLLRSEYLSLAELSKKIDPHWKDVMCMACHEGEPMKGAAPLKEGGDLLRLCYRCHAFKYSRNEIHPVNMKPSPYVAIPPDMPLDGGRVTCETCHDSSLQEGGEGAGSAGRTNPKFLRGGFTSRNEFCLRCHSQESIRALNAHLQLFDDGSANVVICAFCHSSLPGIEAGWITRTRFSGDEVNDLCLLCHTSLYLENHPQVPHLVRPSGEMMEVLESAEERLGVVLPLYDDRIVCVTCHNPHQEGVIRETGASKGAGAVKRLRLGFVTNICQGCHLEK